VPAARARVHLPTCAAGSASCRRIAHLTWAQRPRASAQSGSAGSGPPRSSVSVRWAARPPAAPRRRPTHMHTERPRVGPTGPDLSASMSSIAAMPTLQSLPAAIGAGARTRWPDDPRQVQTATDPRPRCPLATAWAPSVTSRPLARAGRGLTRRTGLRLLPRPPPWPTRRLRPRRPGRPLDPRWRSTRLAPWSTR
jgi:hypothetical protein